VRRRPHSYKDVILRGETREGKKYLGYNFLVKVDVELVCGRLSRSRRDEAQK
jgi:hypothetical protein